MVSVEDLKNELSYQVLVGKDINDKYIKGCYTGDFLSWVMSKAKPKDAWVTVMGNINAIAVATLADISCIILAEDAYLDEDARDKAIQHNIAVLRTHKNSYDTCVEIYKLLKVTSKV